MSFIKYLIVDYWKEIGHEESKDLKLFNSGLTIPLIITALTIYLTRLASQHPKKYDLRPIRIVFYAIFFGVFGAGLALGYYILNRFSIFFQCNPPELIGLIKALKPYFISIIPALTNLFNFHFVIVKLEKRQPLNYIHFAYHLATNVLFFVFGIVHPSEVNALALVSEVYCLMIYSAMQILDASSTEVRYETIRIRKWFLGIYRLSRLITGLVLIYHAYINSSGLCACYPYVVKLEYIFGVFEIGIVVLDVIMKNDHFDLPVPPKQKVQ